MAEGIAEGPRRRGPRGSGPPDLDETIVQTIGGRSEVAFDAIVREVTAVFPVSRATLARRLARLCRTSRVVRLRHGRYATTSASARTPHKVLRMRAITVTEFLSPDGSARLETAKEFSVLSGQCDRLTFGISPIAHLKAKDVGVTSDRRTQVETHNERGRTVIAVRFEPPIPTSPRVTHRLVLSYGVGPGFYGMQPSRGAAGPGAPARSIRNTHSMGVLSNPDVGTHMEANEKTTITLRIHFPSGFPRGPVRPEVVSILSEKPLEEETESLRALSKKSGGSLGLTVHKDLVTLAVGNPVVDSYYGFTWAPARSQAVARWARRQAAVPDARRDSSH